MLRQEHYFLLNIRMVLQRFCDTVTKKSTHHGETRDASLGFMKPPSSHRTKAKVEGKKAAVVVHIRFIISFSQQHMIGSQLLLTSQAKRFFSSPLRCSSSIGSLSVREKVNHFRYIRVSGSLSSLDAWRTAKQLKVLHLADTRKRDGGGHYDSLTM